MKSLVVYYSLDGNTRFIAQCIAKELNADILELKTKKQPPSKGFLKYLVGGAGVVLKRKPELVNKKININKYDHIFMGTPVWAGGFVPAFNTFASEYEISNKYLGFFACYAGDGAGKVFEKFKDIFPNNHFLGEIGFREPLKHDSQRAGLRASDWISLLPFKV
jgi:flavodoxin